MKTIRQILAAMLVLMLACSAPPAPVAAFCAARAEAPMETGDPATPPQTAEAQSASAPETLAPVTDVQTSGNASAPTTSVPAGDAGSASETSGEGREAGAEAGAAGDGTTTSADKVAAEPTDPAGGIAADGDASGEIMTPPPRKYNGFARSGQR